MSSRCKHPHCTLWPVGEGYCATHLYAARHRAHCIEVRNNPIKVKRRKPARTPTHRKPGAPIAPEHMGWFYRGKTNA